MTASRLVRPLASFAALVLAAPLSAAEPSATDWSQWRGPDRTGVGASTGLLREWPEGGPKVLWKAEDVGAGYSSVVVANGRLWTQGDLGGIEHVICLDANDGSRIWAVQPEPVRARLEERVDREFAAADANGDGTIDELEALDKLGWKFNDFDRPVDGADAAALAAARVEAVFAAHDANRDGRLEPREASRGLLAEFAAIDRAEKEADAKALAGRRTEDVFATRDTDEDGRLSKQEVRGTPLDEVFNRADQRVEGNRRGDEMLTRQEVAGYFERFEAGKDGIVTRDELRALYETRYAGRDGRLSREELSGHYGGYRHGKGNGPRGTPTLDGDRLYAEGGNGDVTCLDAATGKTIWHTSLVEDFGGKVPGWGYSESPLVTGNLVIVTPGGKDGTMVALDKTTGELVWRTGELTQSAHYASPVVATIGGIEQIVQFARESAFGVDRETGELLWQYEGAANGTANCATPIVDGNLVFTSSAYGTGGGLARIETSGSQQKAEEVYFSKEMANHHGGIVKIGDHLYGFGNGGLICMDFATGVIAWRDRSVGKGSLAAADGLLFLLGENHQVALATATPEGYEELGRFEIESHDLPSWAHPAVANGRLFIRDQHELTCYDVAK